MKKKIINNPHSNSIAEKFEQLVDIMYTLRSDGGCPWDRAQTIQDLRQYLLEETYEVLEALDEKTRNSNSSNEALQEELGDLLFQVVFLAQMMQESNEFTLTEVLDHLLEKMIRRHPHVFGDAQAGSPDEALANWESMKRKQSEEKKGSRRSLLEGVPKALPALLQANLISAKVARVGFDWKTEEEVWKKFEEELEEFRNASNRKEKQEEMGDLLFTLVNIARKNQINPEDALREANTKFRSRFSLLEEKLHLYKREWKETSLEELDAIWNDVKKGIEKKGE